MPTTYTSTYRDKDGKVIGTVTLAPAGVLPATTVASQLPLVDYGIDNGVQWINMMITRSHTRIGIWAVDEHAWRVLTDPYSRRGLIQTAPPGLAPSTLSLPIQTLVYPNGSEVHFEKKDALPLFTPPHQEYDGAWFCGASTVVDDTLQYIKDTYTPLFRGGKSLGLVYVT